MNLAAAPGERDGGCVTQRSRPAATSQPGSAQAISGPKKMCPPHPPALAIHLVGHEAHTLKQFAGALDEHSRNPSVFTLVVTGTGWDWRGSEIDPGKPLGLQHPLQSPLLVWFWSTVNFSLCLRGPRTMCPLPPGASVL